MLTHHSIFMEMVLPISIPVVQTYQNSAFTLGIIQANDDVKYSFFNHYVNLKCFRNKSLSEIELRFANDDWNDYCAEGIVELDLFHIRNIHKDCFLNFIKERIDQGNYLLFYNIDDYYLSYSSSFNKTHFVHDTYVYGYTDDELWVMAYKDRKLQKFSISSAEIINGIYSVYEVDPDVSFCSFRPNSAYAVGFEVNKYYQQITKYLKPDDKKDQDIAWGIDVYEVLNDCICTLKNKEDVFNMDLRPFRLLDEHKKMMILHYHECKRYFQTDNQIEQAINEMEVLADRIFRLAIKFNITHSKLCLDKIEGYLDGLRKQEIEILSDVQRSLKGYLGME